MKWPLLFVALVYAAGILLAERTGLRIIPVFILAFTVTGFALFWSRFRFAILWPAILLTGTASHALRTEILSPVDLRTLLGEQTENVIIRGRLRETPTQRLYEQNEKESWRTIANVKVEAWRRGRGPWEPARGLVAVSTPGLLPSEFFGGRTVEIPGALGPPHGPIAPGLFDYRTYLRHLGIYYQLRVRSGEDWFLPPSAAKPPLSD